MEHLLPLVAVFAVLASHAFITLCREWRRRWIAERLSSVGRLGATLTRIRAATVRASLAVLCWPMAAHMVAGRDAAGQLIKQRVGSLAGRFEAGFVFQAEDGIRVGTVTGVQTCALPISTGPTPRFYRSLQGVVLNSAPTYVVLDPAQFLITGVSRPC